MLIGQPVVTVAPATEPLSVAEAKAHSRVTGNDDDTYFLALITAAREHVESILGRALITQTRQYYLHDWPTGPAIVLPFPPLQAVSAVAYYTATGSDWVSWASTNYQVDTVSVPGRVVLVLNASWPSVTLRAASGVRITYTCGYGNDATDVPQGIRHAMLGLVGHWYEHREAVIPGTIVAAMPEFVQALLAKHRAEWF